MPIKKRYFSNEELEDFKKDFSMLIMEALNKGDSEKAKDWLRLSDEFKDFVHDLYLHWVTELLSRIYDLCGEEEAIRTMRDTVKRYTYPLMRLKAKMVEAGQIDEFVKYLTNFCRHHAMFPGFKLEEDDEKFIITFNPCGSGGRLINSGAYDGPMGYRKMETPGYHTWGEKDVPIYCMHCAFCAEILPVAEMGDGAQIWINPKPFPKKPEESCMLYIYKDAKYIPDEYYERIGMKRKPKEMKKMSGLSLVEKN